MSEISAERQAMLRRAETAAKAILKPGDRIRVSRCGGIKRTYVFDGWDGRWIVSRSGFDDIHPVNIDRLNGAPIDFSGSANRAGRGEGVNRKAKYYPECHGSIINHKGVRIYTTDKYGVISIYWFSTRPGVHAEVAPTEPQFDVRELPAECFPEGRYTSPYRLKDGPEFALDKTMVYSMKAIIKAIDLGIDLEAESARQSAKRHAFWEAERERLSLRPQILDDDDDDIPF